MPGAGGKFNQGAKLLLVEARRFTLALLQQRLMQQIDFAFETASQRTAIQMPILDCERQQFGEKRARLG